MKIASPILMTVLLAATVAADDFASYRNSSYKYAIIYPADWKKARDDGKVFSVLNKSNDVNINVVIEEVSPPDRGHYKSITDIPNVRELLTEQIRQTLKMELSDSGTTVLSNETALWSRFYYTHRSLDVEVWFVVYQIVTLKNDIFYTIGAKVSGLSKKEADTKFKKYWPTIKTSLVSFTLTEIVK